MKKDFPINVFPDVERDAFNKHTKKNVTEDYIYENLQLRGWVCYKPFSDTGIDIIATKKNKKGQWIYRFIQIKTRSLNQENIFGYTLKPKDFRTDPRHFFLFYCDSVNDIVLIGMNDYINIFFDHEEMGKNHFANKTFRTNNNKLNSLTYNNHQWTWTYKHNKKIEVVDFGDYVNEKGLEKMEDPNIDDNIKQIIKSITDKKFAMFYRFNKTRNNRKLFGGKMDGIIENKMYDMKIYPIKKYVENIKKIDNQFRTEHSDLYESHKKYIYGCINDGDEDQDEK